jgi:hypothetical protein
MGAIPDDGAVVFAPAHPYVRGWTKDVVFETRAMADGGSLGIAFSSVDELVSTLGPDQPWVALRVRDFRELLGDRGVTMFVFDPPLPREAWRWTSEGLAELLRSNDG